MWLDLDELLKVVDGGCSWRLHEIRPTAYPPPTAGEALGQLAASRELARRFSSQRWVRVRDCRRSGASWAQIAEVLEVTADEARDGFVGWVEWGRRDLGVASYPPALDVLAAGDMDGLDGMDAPGLGVSAPSTS